MKNSLNTRLKMALLLQLGESGFAMVIAVSLGLIMLMVGLTMIMRSQNDQIVATNQKQTEESIAIAEKGIAFYQSFLNSSGLYRRLAQYPDCRSRDMNAAPGTACTDNANQLSWASARNITGFSSACRVNFDDLRTVYANTGWKDVDNPLSSILGPKQFRLVKYEYIRPASATGGVGLGRLIVEGRITEGNNNNSNKSITRLQVDIPIGDGDLVSVPVPGVWVSSPSDADGTARSNINGDVLVNRCFNSSIDPVDADNFTTMQDNIIPPSTVKVTDISMPAIPSDIRNMSPRVISTILQNPPLPGPNDNPAEDEFDQAGYIDLGTISSNIILPDNSEDVSNTASPKVADGRFRGPLAGKDDVHTYRITGITGNTTVTIRPGARVAFLLYGNIDRNVNIQCNQNEAPQSPSPGTNTDYNTAAMNSTPRNCKPSDIMIFGMNSTGTICINGNRIIEGFVYAPTYTVGVAGGGSVSPGNFVGAVWANQWGNNNCSSSATGGTITHVSRPGTWTWEDVPSFAAGSVDSQMPPSIGRAGAWQKLPVN